MIKLIIIRRIGRPSIEIEKIAKFRSLINSIEGLIKNKIGIEGEIGEICKSMTKMREIKKFRILINSISDIIEEKHKIWSRFA